MNARRGVVAVTALLGLAGAGPAAADPELRLPAPTGHHHVGTTSLYLNDVSRPDPWVPSAGTRELMVSLWYPTAQAGGPRAQYLTPAESELLLADGNVTSVPPDVLSTVRTNAVRDAKPAGRHLPLVVLSPGFTKPRGTLTALAEDLASNGYVVAAISHTYENVGTSFPDGRVTTCAACELPDRGPEFWEKLTHGRAADVSFVIDELVSRSRLIDPSRIAMVGHSAGGSSVSATMAADRRVRAGVNIDGSPSVPVPDTGLARPFLLLGKESSYTPGTGGSASTWELDWSRLSGWKRWLVVSGAVHVSFTDISILSEQIGWDTGADVTALRTAAITRAYVGAFLDKHLRHEPQPLLNGPTTRYPEVKFCHLAQPSGCEAAR